MRNLILAVFIVLASCSKPCPVQPSIANTEWAYSQDSNFHLYFTSDSLSLMYAKELMGANKYLRENDTFYLAPQYSKVVFTFTNDSLFYTEATQNFTEHFYRVD